MFAEGDSLASSKLLHELVSLGSEVCNPRCTCFRVLAIEAIQEIGIELAG